MNYSLNVINNACSYRSNETGLFTTLFVSSLKYKIMEYDFRYKTTLRIDFDIDVYSDDEDDELNDKVDDVLHELLDDLSEGEEMIEIDWRDEREVEIHNINQDDFNNKFKDQFINQLKQKYQNWVSHNLVCIFIKI
jgi:hypothetical protein